VEAKSVSTSHGIRPHCPPQTDALPTTKAEAAYQFLVYSFCAGRTAIADKLALGLWGYLASPSTLSVPGGTRYEYACNKAIWVFTAFWLARVQTSKRWPWVLNDQRNRYSGEQLSAWKFRYPGDAGTPSPEEARNALAVAEEIFRGVKTEMPSESGRRSTNEQRSLRDSWQFLAVVLRMYWPKPA
jgi:hypothetical protein